MSPGRQVACLPHRVCSLGQQQSHCLLKLCNLKCTQSIIQITGEKVSSLMRSRSQRDLTGNERDPYLYHSQQAWKSTIVPTSPSPTLLTSTSLSKREFSIFLM
eukprot:GHVN01007443.1.p1 GENE.GHVN01007443.1~~GHVN01007443.1.p1  ORF type:complete len:103 (+),score=12.43 GHVN01007443.1:94-402(+)